VQETPLIYDEQKTVDNSLSERSSYAVADGSGVPDVPAPGISTKTLDKFRQLQKRREEMSRRSTMRRVEELKADVATKIKQQFANDDEIEALQQHNVDLSQLDSASAKRKRRRPTNANDNQCASAGKADSDATSIVSECTVDSRLQSEWLDVKQHLNVNSHLTDETGGSEAPKSHLERAVNLAIAVDEFELAEKLSDRLSNRDFGTKIATAFDAKRFIDQRKCEEEARKAAKKKKLAWGFEHKQRWETKGNM
jgi:hypothetical protein